MNKKWPQQGVFVERVKAFCRKNDLLTPRGAVKVDILSDMVDLNEDSLRQILQDTTRTRPHINTLSQVAKVLECSVTEFIDAPSHPPPGMSQEQWAELSEHERVLLVATLADLTSDDLSAAEKEELYQAFHEAKLRILRLRDAWKDSHPK
jgi:hypothetical protein